jgi:hypothetical protein
MEVEPRPPDHVHYVCVAVEHSAPPDHWPLLAGDAIQNLRSALEHVAWTAAVPGHKSRTQFPIFKDAREYARKGRPMIAGLPAPVQTLIEQTQPYNAVPDGPTFDPLWQLSELSNLDKHRTLATVAGAVDTPYFGWAGATEDTFEFTHVGFNQPLHEGAHVASVLATADVDVDPNLIYRVAIEGRPLVGTLQGIVRRVFEVVALVETGQDWPAHGRQYPQI